MLGVKRALRGMVAPHSLTDTSTLQSGHPDVPVTGRVVVKGDGVLTPGVVDLVGNKLEGGIGKDHAHPVLGEATFLHHKDIQDLVVGVSFNEEMSNLPERLQRVGEGGVQVFDKNSSRGDMGEALLRQWLEPDHGQIPIL